MITVNELREVLRSIGFVERNDVFSNSYSSGASIDVNFKEKKIIYSPVDEDFKEGLFPTKEKQANGFVIHRDTTLNFSANENFVCLICVHFLLKKGYEAKHIVFEPAFKVGHVNKPCIAVDAEIKKANEKIGDLEEKINALVKNINGVKYKLGKIAQFKNGLNYDKSSAGEEVSIVGVADFKDNKSPIWDDVEKVVINGKLEDSFLLQKNDLLTVRSNGSQELVGRFMIVNKDLEEKTTFSGFTIRVRPDSEVVKSEFLYYILSSPIIRKQLVVGSNGSNIKSLNQTLLANVEISIPSMKKQEEILSELLAIENQIIEQRSIIEFGQEKKNRIIEDELI